MTSELWINTTNTMERFFNMRSVLFLIIVFTIVSCSKQSPQIPYQQYVLDGGARISLIKLNNGKSKLCFYDGESLYQTLITNTSQMPFIDTVVNDTIMLVYDNFLCNQDSKDTLIVMKVPTWEESVGPLTIKYISYYHLMSEKIAMVVDVDSTISYYFPFDSLSMDNKQWFLFYGSECIASLPQNRLVCEKEENIGYLLYGVSYDACKRISTTTKYKPKSQKLIWEYWGHKKSR